MEIIDSKKKYKAPQATVVELKSQYMLCQSDIYGHQGDGNGRMDEVDYVDGGFGQF